MSELKNGALSVEQTAILHRHGLELGESDTSKALAERVLQLPDCGDGWFTSAAITLAAAHLELIKAYSVSDQCHTRAVVALRHILAEWGRDPSSGMIDWQRCVDRIHSRATQALEACRVLGEAMDNG